MFGGKLPSGIFPGDVLLYWDGGPSDRRTKVPFTNTSTTEGSGIHGANSLVFNATTSKVDAGSQIAGAGDITVVAWLNATGFGEGTTGTIVDNGTLIVRINDLNDCVNVSSDGATLVVSETGSIVVATETFIAVTRTSAGVVNIYKNGVLSGSADLASGTPAGGSTNLILGNNNAAALTFDGTLSHIRIFNKILTTTQIGQIYNREK